MNDINLNVPYARIIPEKTIKRFTTRFLDDDMMEPDLYPGDFIANRFEILEVLPDIGLLRCYHVTDHQNINRCGSCGITNISDSSTFCDRCGYNLADTKFSLLEVTTAQMSGFELLIENNLYHKGIIRFFELIRWNKKNYVAAQYLTNRSLSDVKSKIYFSQAIRWIKILLRSIHFLHRHNLFNANLLPTGFYIFPAGPKLIDFSDALIVRSNAEKWEISDIKNIAKTLSLLLPKIEPKDNNMLYLKSIIMNAIQGEYQRVKDLLDEIIRLGRQLEKNKSSFQAKKTILLSDKGVSISVGMASDVGMVRNLNEDSVSALELTNIVQSVSTPYGFYMVADGMGGHSAGEEASKIAVEYITRKIIRSLNNNFESAEQKVKQILEDAVFAANQEINKISQLKNNTMGTTITIAYVANNRAFIFNIGDARGYLYTNNKLKLITQDHSLVYRLYKIGQLTYDEIYHHPNNNQILFALGDANLKQSLINLAEKANHPYFFEIALERGDGILLCTDGLWQMLRDYEIEEVLNKNLQPQKAVDELIQLANKNGGDDNISLVYVKTQ